MKIGYFSREKGQKTGGKLNFPNNFWWKTQQIEIYIIMQYIIVDIQIKAKVINILLTEVFAVL